MIITICLYIISDVSLLVYRNTTDFVSNNFSNSISSNSFLTESLGLSRTSLVAQMVKASTYNEGDPGSIPGSERCPGEGNGNRTFCV